MRSAILLVSAAALAAAFFALPKLVEVDPKPAEVYVHKETGERIVIDEVGIGTELYQHYRKHNFSLGARDLTDGETVASMVVPIWSRVDSLGMSFSYVTTLSVEAEPGEVYVLDDEWHGAVPVNVAYIYSTSWLHAKYERAESGR